MKLVVLFVILLFGGCSDGAESITSPVTESAALEPLCPKCQKTLRKVTMLIGLPNQDMIERMRHGEVLLGGCVGDPANPPIAFVCEDDRIWKTSEMGYWQPLPNDFGRAK